MANKEATVLIMDVNPSMRRVKDANGKTNHDKAHQALCQILTSKLIAGRKGDHVALMLVGTEETDNVLAEDDQYAHIKMYRSNDEDEFHMGPTDLKMLRYVDQGTEKGTAVGDLLDAMIIALHTLEQHCGHYKFQKKIYLFTDAENAIDPDGLPSVMAQAKQLDAHFSIIVFEPDVKIEDHDAKELRCTAGHLTLRMKKSNVKILRDFVEQSDGDYYEGQEALDTLNALRSKQVKPVTLLQGMLTLGDPDKHPDESFQIPIQVYSKTMEIKLPSAKKWSAIAESIPADDRDEVTYGAVEMHRSYKLAVGDDLDLGSGSNMAGSSSSSSSHNPAGSSEEIPKDDLVKAYKYGKTLVPFSAADEEAMKLVTDKGMSILGFVKRDQIPRRNFMSNTLAVMPKPDNARASKLFYLLMQGLEECNCAALVRYVRCSNANPKLGVLWPSKRDWAWWVQMPFAEDLRLYSFAPLEYLLDEEPSSLASDHGNSNLSNSLSASIRSTDSTRAKKKSKLDARQVPYDEVMTRMDDFIDAMDLNEAVETAEGPKEAFRPKDVFNPAWQRLYQCIADRAIHPEKKELPPVDPKISACIDPIWEMLEKAKAPAKKLAEAFVISKVEKKGTKRGIDSVNPAVRTEDVLNLGATSSPANGVKVEEESADMRMQDLMERRVDSVTTIDPVSDFEAMVNDRREDRVSEAVKQMTGVIQKLVSESFGDQLYDKAMSCLVVLREKCAQENESIEYNDWFRQFKQFLTSESARQHMTFWNRVCDKKISLITHNEALESAVTQAESDNVGLSVLTLA
ncbi:SPOC like C-terminal domain-containing protein [Phlyctochytrium arcticum]|nr:SPOC like C-terminal domain-containing protein [Phlyctochytrium arcticum]